MLHLQEYLIKNPDLNELREKYLIKHRRHGLYNNLVLFSYDIGCPFTEPMQLEARGIVLDEGNNWNCVVRPFSKFWNAGESRAAVIDWPSAVVSEKLDGSLICCTLYNGQWNYSTTGTPDANTPVGDFGITFSQLFEQTLIENNLVLPKLEDITFIFELCSGYNQVVVRHEKAKIYLLAARRPSTGEYLDIKQFKLPQPKLYSFRTLEECVDSLNHFKGIDQEGYVICDKDNNRIKIKHPDYVTLHHTVSSTNLKSLVTIALKGEVGETLAYFPHLTDSLNNIKTRLENKTSYLDGYYKSVKNIPIRKDFALTISSNPYRAILFKMKDTNKSALEILREERIENVINYLELKG